MQFMLLMTQSTSIQYMNEVTRMLNNANYEGDFSKHMFLSCLWIFEESCTAKYSVKHRSDCMILDFQHV